MNIRKPQQSGDSQISRTNQKRALTRRELSSWRDYKWSWTRANFIASL